MTNMQDWVDRNPYKCDCGGDTANVGTYGHATWCTVYIAPPPINDKCGCGIGGWHSPLCKFREWPQDNINVEKEYRKIMKEAVELLNSNSIFKK